MEVGFNSPAPEPVRAELVEALSFYFMRWARREEQPFDRLRANGD
jgi:hypothetical protein